MAEIRIYGDAVLRKRAVEVTRFDDGLRAFVEQMLIDMVEYDGVGLAANQVGVLQRVVVIDITAGEQPALVLVNPQLTWVSEQMVDDEEGCLSVPDIRLKVSRPDSVSVLAKDQTGTEVVIEKAEGLLARALQHEIDHLNGILFVDRAAPVYRRLVDGKLKKLAKASRDRTQSE